MVRAAVWASATRFHGRAVRTVVLNRRPDPGGRARNYGAGVAKLRFFFGTMGSGKSTQALQIHHNLRSRRLTGVLATKLDRSGGRVSSRLGVAAEALDAAVQAQVELLCRAAPRATGMAKALVRQVLAERDPAACDRANAGLIAALRVSPEGQEGLGASLEKRTPAWATEA